MMLPRALSVMPPAAPLEMRPQDFDRAPEPKVTDAATPEDSFGWRMALFLPALLGTALLIAGLYGWLAETGMTGLEWVLLTMIGATFVWVSLSVSTVGVAVAGLLARETSKTRAPADVAPLDVALLVPIYNEDPSAVFGNAAAMLEDLAPSEECASLQSFHPVRHARTTPSPRMKPVPLPRCARERPRVLPSTIGAGRSIPTARSAT